MSTSEMTSSKKLYPELAAIIDQYNAELSADVPNANVLNDLETQAKEKCKKIANALIKEKLSELLVYTNPMLELARVLEIKTPTVKLNKDQITGNVVSMSKEDRLTALPADAMTALLKRYTAKDGFVSTGVFANGAVWAYKAERLAFLMTQRVAEALEVDADAKKSIKDTYKYSVNAEGVTGVKDPTSNKQMVALIQEIMDAFCFVDNGNGNNALHCTNKDLAFIEAKFTGRDNKNALAVKVAAGRNITTYIVQVAHALVTGKPYEVTGFKQKDGSAAITYKPFKEPVPVSEKRVLKAANEGEAA